MILKLDILKYSYWLYVIELLKDLIENSNNSMKILTYRFKMKLQS